MENFCTSHSFRKGDKVRIIADSTVIDEKERGYYQYAAGETGVVVFDHYSKALVIELPSGYRTVLLQHLIKA